MMRYLVLLPILFLVGCASVQAPGYISRVDHPYQRKLYAGFDKIVSSVMYVLKEKGWVINSEVDPSIYERDDRYDNNGYQNLLIITEVKKKSLHFTSMRLNVFIHSLGNACDLEVRYEADTHLVKQFSTSRNDQAVQDILDAIEDEISR